jgi:gliding motility associated protien GldN
MKKLTVIFLIGTGLLLAGHPEASSQDLTLGSIYQKENVPYRRPVPLPHLREADIVWSKIIWRMVDLRDKMNHPLYFPTEPFGSRMSLIDVLYNGVLNGEILAYNSEEFRDTFDLEAVQNNLGAETTTTTVVDVETGQMVERQIEGEVRTHEVREYLVLEQWYFDKQHSTFRSRVIGFAPIRVYQRRDDDGNETGEWQKRQVFWVYYPHIRDALARSEAYTNNNDLASLSFDDIFMQRRFSGYIYRESNVYDNRAIIDYAMGRDAMYESERIQNAIFDFEQDLWEY